MSTCLDCESDAVASPVVRWHPSTGSGRPEFVEGRDGNANGDWYDEQDNTLYCLYDAGFDVASLSGAQAGQGHRMTAGIEGMSKK